MCDCVCDCVCVCVPTMLNVAASPLIGRCSFAVDKSSQRGAPPRSSTPAVQTSSPAPPEPTPAPPGLAWRPARTPRPGAPEQGAGEVEVSQGERSSAGQQVRKLLVQGNRRVEALAVVIQHLFTEVRPSCVCVGGGANILAYCR